MEIDWGQALEIGGLGFGLVFIVLIILALVMWAMGALIRKYGPKDDNDEVSVQKGEGV